MPRAVVQQPKLLDSSMLVRLHDSVVRLPRVHILVCHRLHHRIGGRGTLHREYSPEGQANALIVSLCKGVHNIPIVGLGRRPNMPLWFNVVGV